MRKVLLKILLLSVTLAGCRAKSVEEWDTSTAGSVEVTAEGHRFNGLYLTAKSDGEVIAASGVLLLSGENQPECSITHENGDTLVEVTGRRRRFIGRPLLILDSDDELKVVAEDIPMSRYDSEAHLTEAIEELLLETLSSND